MWNKVRRLMITLPAVVLAALLTVQPVLAAAPASNPASAVEVGCREGVCHFELDLGAAGGGFWLRALENTVNRLPSGVSMQVEDDVLLTLPMGTLVLPDADLTLEFGPDRRIVSMHGTTQMPVPTFGLLGGLEWVTPARVDVGYELGADLATFGAPLDPTRRYLYMTLDAGLTAVNRGDQPPLQLTVPSGQHTALIVDLSQPLLYVDGEVNLRYLGDLAFVRQLVDPASAMAWWPTGLLLPQSINLGVSGVIGQGVTPNLALKAGYRVEPGMIGQWLRLDGALVEAEGSMVLGPQGLLLAGQAHSALMPQALAENALAAQVFIPFDDVQTAYARLQTALEALPTAEIATVETTPAETTPAETTLAETAAAETASTPVAQPNRLARIAEQPLDDLMAGAGQVAESAQAGYAAVAQGTGAGIGWLAGAVTDGMHYTNDQWCAVTGRCAVAPQASITQD